MGLGGARWLSAEAMHSATKLDKHTHTHTPIPMRACVPTWASKLIVLFLLFIVINLIKESQYPTFICTSLITSEVKLLSRVFLGHLPVWLVCGGICCGDISGDLTYKSTL